MASKPRLFRKPKNAQEEKKLLENAVPKSTRSVNKWAVKIFTDWQSSRVNKKPETPSDTVQDLETDIIEMTAESLNFWLTKFTMEVCKQSGERYPPRTLYSIVCGIQRHLEDNNGGDGIRILAKTEHRLTTFRRALDAEMKQANFDGVRKKSKRPEREGITAEEEKTLWDKDLLGCHNAKTLLHTIYYYNGKLFGLRANEHRNLRYNNFKVDSNSITFDESVSKTYHGGIKDLKYTPRVVKHICCPSVLDANHYPCLVNCYAKYLENVKLLCQKNDAFYFRANANKDKFSFDNSPVGINSLNNILPGLCAAAGLERKTSHSLRITCATTLFQNSVEEKFIRERTGHRSNALFNYDKPNLDQQCKVSEILGPAQEKESKQTVMETNEIENCLFPDLDLDISDELLMNIPYPSDSNSKRENFSRSVFNNCTFNITDK